MADSDWYEKHKTDVAVALKRGKTAVKDDPIYCTLVRTKDATDVLCAHVNLTKAASMVKEGRAAKGKVVSAGRLYAGDAGPTFEVSEGDLSIKARFAKAAALALGSPMNVIVIGAEGLAVPDPEGAPPAAPPAPTAPSGDSAAFRERIDKVLPLVQQAGQKAPDRKALLDQVAAQAVGAAKVNDFAQALNLVGRLEAATAMILGAAPPRAAPPAPAGPPPPAAPAAPPPAPRADAAAFKARLKVVLPLYKEAAAKAPSQRDDLGRLAAQGSAAGQAKKFDEAVTLLDQLEARSRAALRAGAGPRPPDEAPAAPSPPADADGKEAEEEKSREAPAEAAEFQELYNGLLDTIPGDLRRLRETDAGVAEKIQNVVGAAAALAAKGDFQKAFGYLNRAAEAMAKTADAGHAKEAAEVIPEGKVAAMKAALSQAQSKWDAALAAARRMKPIQAALRDDFPSAAAGVNNILDSYEQDLLDELRAGQAQADEDGVAAAVRGTLDKVRSLRAEAAGDKVFTYLEECGVPVKAAFVQAFDEVEGLLQV